MHHLSADYSTLGSDGLVRLVREEYGLADPRVILLRRGFNDNYRVTAGDERYILRVYLHGKHYVSGPDDLRFELDLLDHLAAEGVGVATAVPRRGGEKLGALEAPEGVRYYALFRYAPGVAVPSPSEAQTRALGATVAQLHLATDRFETGYPRQSLGVGALLDASLERLAPYLADNPDELAYVRDVAGKARARLVSLGTAPGVWGIIHGDPHAGNCHFDGDRPVLFDFDTCGYGWRAYDVGIVMGDRDYEHRPAFLEAYRAVRPLSEVEVALLPVFKRARSIWDAGDILTMTPVWGELMAVRVVRSMMKELRRVDEENA